MRRSHNCLNIDRLDLKGLWRSKVERPHGSTGNGHGLDIGNSEAVSQAESLKLEPVYGAQVGYRKGEMGSR